MIGPLIVALALFGSSSALTDEMISKLDLIKVIILYGVLGFLFISAAAIFGFSKDVPSGKIEGKFESSSKALRSLLIMSGMLILIFIPVFSSYSSKEAKTISKLETQLKSCNKQLDSFKINIEPKGNEKDILAQSDKGIETKIKQLETKIKQLKQPLDKSRMLWLFAAFIVVIMSLLITNLSAKSNPEGWGLCAIHSWYLG